MSNPLSKNFKRRRLLTLALLTLGLAAASVAGALPFETVYGAMGQVDRANRGVTPVTGCQGGGSIAVGTRGSFPNSLVYVARTDDWGNRLWERLYDIRPVNGDGRYGDTGESIVEVHDGTGFVIAGQTRDAEASLDAFLLKVDCEGLLSWVRIYHSPFDEGALDLVEATTGDPDFGTRRGDLIVAGFGIFPGTNLRNALLFRTSSTGTLIWGRRYTIFDEVRSAFRSVIETSPSGGTTTGDIVAAGRIVMGGPEQGYVVRVSGNTGTEAGVPHCAAAYPGQGRSRFDAVLGHGAGSQGAQDLVMTGRTGQENQPYDIFLARSTPNPCAAVAQMAVGALDREETAFDLQNVPFDLPIAGADSLAVTGRATVSAGGTDAFLLLAYGTTLMPFAGRLFDGYPPAYDPPANEPPADEVGRSLAVLPKGILIAGRTTADFEGVGDPADLYLIGADGNGHTDCSEDWSPPHQQLDAEPIRVHPYAYPVLQEAGAIVYYRSRDTHHLVCER